MNWFEKTERYYQKGLYTNEDVKLLVQAGKITEAEYKEITKQEYSA